MDKSNFKPSSEDHHRATALIEDFHRICKSKFEAGCDDDTEVVKAIYLSQNPESDLENIEDHKNFGVFMRFVNGARERYERGDLNPPSRN